MKTCPFCAEEIQDAAIKCRYCGSFLSTAPPAAQAAAAGKAASTDSAGEASSGATDEDEAGKGESAAKGDDAAKGESAAQGDDAAAETKDDSPILKRHDADDDAEDDKRSDRDEPGRASASRRKVLYSGYPSWRAYLKHYVLLILATAGVTALCTWIGFLTESTNMTIALLVACPLAVGIIIFFSIGLYRKSRLVRVSTTNIETEYGILSKKIDVLELWRCRDVRYRQSLMDRILRIAHIQIFTDDVTTPNLEMVGLPASRELFEKIRDSIEIQRQSRNVLGIVQ